MKPNGQQDATLAKNPLGRITRIFIILLGIQTIIELVIGTAMLVNFPLAVESGFQLNYIEDMDFLGTVIGLQLLFLTAIMVVAIVLTRKGKKSGAIIGIVVGSYFAIFGFVAFALYGQVNGIFVDSIRGIATIVLGFLALQELEN